MRLIDLDRQITELLRLDLVNNSEKVLYFVASSIVYLLPLLLLVLFFRSQIDRLNSVKIALAAALSWLVMAKFVGTILYNYYAFRDRPFASRGVGEYLFEQPEKAFPSDHAAVFAAVITMLYALGYKKVANFALILALASVWARVAIGFHWFGDIVGGVAIGALGAAVVILFGVRIDRMFLAVQSYFGRKNERKSFG